jgi:hypothetical protein
MKASRPRSTKSAPAWTPRIARSPRVTIALIVGTDGDVGACVARLASHCDRTGSYGLVVTTACASLDESLLGRRVRVVPAPADFGGAELRHLAMQHSEGDIVLLEDVSSGEELSVSSAASRDLGDRSRACVPVSEWRDILIAHGVADVALPRPVFRGAVRVGVRPVRESVPVMADAHHPA